MSRVIQTLTVLFCFCVFSSQLKAQYLNVDSLVFIPGYEFPVTHDEFKLMLNELQSENITAGQELYYGQKIPAGKLLSHFVIPADGKVISRYGMRSGRMHTGTDIKMAKGDTIYAAFHGVVTRSKYYYGYGNMVVLDHGNEIETCYAHLSEFLVKAGQAVERNQPIGLAGSTGRATTSHLHFEIKESGKFYNPELVYDFGEGRIKEEAVEIQYIADLKTGHRNHVLLADGTLPVSYTVMHGDSLWKISRRFKTSVESLCEINNIDKNTILNVGMQIKLF